jgi:hypothetical protein
MMIAIKPSTNWVYQMKYMVIETFRPGSVEEVYGRYKKRGRMLPVGLFYLDSWLSTDEKICFQLMETNDNQLFAEWIKNWDDLIDFQIIPVHDSPTKLTQKASAPDTLRQMEFHRVH